MTKIKVRVAADYNEVVIEQRGMTFETGLLDTKESAELALEFLNAAQELLSIEHFRKEMNLIEDVVYDIQAMFEDKGD